MFFFLNGCWHMLRQDGAATMLRSRFQLKATTQIVNKLYDFIQGANSGYLLLTIIRSGIVDKFDLKSHWM